MKVFGGIISPFVRKVCLVCVERGIPYDLVPVSPHSDNPEFRAASPFGLIPAIEDDGYRLADSSAIVTYLEAAHPGTPMLPAEAKARGRAMWFDEFADTVLAGAGLKILFNRFVGPKLLKLPGDEAVALQGEAELPAILDWLEGEAPETGWLAGADFTLGDISVASVLRSLHYVGIAPDPAIRPRTAAWFDRIRARPAWQQIAAIEDAPRKR